MSNETKNKVVPKLRFPEFKDSGEWEGKSLGQLIEIKGRIGYRGYTVEDIVNKGEGAISLSPSNIDETGLLSLNKSTYISWAKYEESPEIMLEEGFTVLVKTGSTFGKTAFIKKLPERATINPQLVVLKPIQVDSFFLFLLVSHPTIQKQIKATVVGGAIPTLSQDSISKFQLFVPSKLEQQKIADCLSSLDELITAQSQKLQALKGHKKGLMQQLFPIEGETVPKLRFAEFKDSEEWEFDVFDSTVEVIDGDRGINYPKAEEFSVSDYCVFLNAKNVTKNGFAFNEIQFISKEKDEAMRKGKLRRLDIILTTRGSVGQFAFYTEKVPYTHLRINSGMVILRENSNLINPNYLYEFCKSETITSAIKNLAFGNAQQQLTVAVIKKLPLFYPKNPKEQQKIADCLSSLDEQISTQTEKIEALKTHKKGLMQALFPQLNGEVNG